MLTLAVGGLLVLFSTSLADLTGGQRQLGREHESSLRAEAAAEAGLAEALYELKQNPDWQAGCQGRLARSQADYAVRFNGSPNCRSASNYGGSQALLGWQGKSIPPGQVHLVSVGRSGQALQVEQMLVDPGRQLMLSTFSNGVDGWKACKGALKPVALLGNCVVGSRVSRVPPSEQWNHAGDPSWTDYTVDGEMTLTSGSGFGIFVRFRNPGSSASGYRFDYDALTNPRHGGAFMLRKVVNGVAQPPFASVNRADTSLGGLLNVKRRFRVVVRGNHLEGYVDGVLVVSGEDASQAFPTGMVAFRGPLNGVLLVDWVRVRAPLAVKARW